MCQQLGWLTVDQVIEIINRLTYLHHPVVFFQEISAINQTPYTNVINILTFVTTSGNISDGRLVLVHLSTWHFQHTQRSWTSHNGEIIKSELICALNYTSKTTLFFLTVRIWQSRQKRQWGCIIMFVAWCSIHPSHQQTVWYRSTGPDHYY